MSEIAVVQPNKAEFEFDAKFTIDELLILTILITETHNKLVAPMNICDVMNSLVSTVAETNGLDSLEVFEAKQKFLSIVRQHIQPDFTFGKFLDRRSGVKNSLEEVNFYRRRYLQLALLSIVDKIISVRKIIDIRPEHDKVFKKYFGNLM